MENRERDRVSQRSSPTDAGEVNRQVEEEKGREHNRGTGAEFGQSIGRSEDLSEGGNVKDKNDNELKNTNLGNESTRRQGSGSYGSQSGRSGSVGNMGGGGSDISNDESSSRSGSRSGSSSNIGDSSEGRH